MKKILIVEDDFAIGKLLEMTLKRIQYEIALARDERTCAERIKTFIPDLILLDLMINNKKSTDFYERFVEEGFNPNIPVIILTASASGLTKIISRSGKSYTALGKPFETRDLIELIQTTLGRVSEKSI